MLDSKEISLIFVFSGRPSTNLLAASMVGRMNLPMEPDVSMTRTTFTGAVCRFISSISAVIPPSAIIMSFFFRKHIALERVIYQDGHFSSVSLIHIVMYRDRTLVRFKIPKNRLKKMHMLI